VQDRTGRCGTPVIMEPIIIAGVPVISAVKFGDPFTRTAITEARVLWPLKVPENTTEF
jgi:hypothetical protein